jgi:hypothetical protein
MLRGLPYLLLVVFGGVGVVSGALTGGFFLGGLQTWLIQLFPDVVISIFGTIQFNLFQMFQRLGSGVLGITIGQQPAGIIPTTGDDVRARRARKAAEASDTHPAPPPSPGDPGAAVPVPAGPAR